MDIIDAIGLCLYLYSMGAIISLLIADSKVKENFTWIIAAACLLWPITIILIFLNFLWEMRQ